MTDWFLEGFMHDGEVLQRLPVEQFPLLIGRQDGLALSGASANMSRYHAELVVRDGRLVLRDLGSKNGTYVNRRRVKGESLVDAGDVLHFADAEFRLGRQESSTSEVTSTGIIQEGELPRNFPTGSRSLEILIEQRSVACLFQPIVALETGKVVAWECLARGMRTDLPETPGALFRIAASIGREVELSELMRTTGVATAAAAGIRNPVFINIHPREVRDLDRLLAHLGAVVGDHPGIDLVLELHEAAITDLEGVASLASGLDSLGVALAYDDFGSGQARLMELVAVPPQFLKFDRSMLVDLDHRPDNQRHMVQMLVRFARDSGILTLAEGITNRDEARACREIGFDYAQGFLFGRPRALNDAHDAESTDDDSGSER